MPELARGQLTRALVDRRHYGVLATLSKQKPGYPFASMTLYAADAQGRPVFLFTTLANHTENLEADPRACLMVLDQDAEAAPQETARAHITGQVRPVPEDEIESARSVYLARHPAAAQWVDFGDFAFYRLEVEEVYWVGGFANAGSALVSDYRAGSTARQ